MNTIGAFLTLGGALLSKKGVADARRVVEEGLAHVLGVPRLELYLRLDDSIVPEKLRRCEEVLDRLAQGEPLAHVVGCVSFHSLNLMVTPDVLTPRPETELLVERVLKGITKKEGVLWDIGCGSGCIGLAIKQAIPSLTVILSDVCPKALAVARANACRNGIEVEFRCGDLLQPFLEEKAHYVVSNLPYVGAEEWHTLSATVRKFEPRHALVGGESGLEMIGRLADALPLHLYAKAKLWLEIGAGQGKETTCLFPHPPWGPSKVGYDWAGHDRFFTVELELLFALS